MQIELNADEIHWLQYSLIIAIAEIPAANGMRQILQRTLEKLPAFES